MSAPRTAMVLAAGLGLRMRPITEHTPKPLIEIDGRTMLDRALDRLRAAGVTRIVVNVHWKAATIRRHLAGQADVTISDETDTLLETGGGVARALPLLGAAPFYAVNADIVWLDGVTPALDRLAAAWNPERMDALLLMQRTPSAFGYDGEGDFFLDAVGVARRRKRREVAPYLFAGVQILHPRLFADTPAGAFSLNLLYDRALAEGRLYGVVHDGAWFHVGTPEALALIEKKLRDIRSGGKSESYQ